jgi:DNA invertase Pin-like site-specific DNA recombinase
MTNVPLRIGYKRVSSTDQNTDRQLDGEQLTMVFEDKASGKDANRPQLQAMLAGNWPRGTVVVVHSFDRLARSLGDLEGIVKMLTGKGLSVEFIKEGKTFHPPGAAGDAHKTAMDTLMLQLLGAFAQYERAMILERQREGILKAKQRGVYKGRPRKVADDDRMTKIVAEATRPGAVKADVAKAHGISRETLYQYIRASQRVTQ